MLTIITNCEVKHNNKLSMNQIDISNLQPTSAMLDEALYWEIIDKSALNTSNQNDQEAYLIQIIEQLSPEQMIGFNLRTDQLLYKSYTSKMALACYSLNDYLSDDTFEYFRLWVISLGKDTYNNVNTNPDALLPYLNPISDYYDFEGLWYVAQKAFKNKTGKEIYDYIDYEQFKYSEVDYPDIDFSWETDHPESMKAIIPYLHEWYQKKHKE